MTRATAAAWASVTLFALAGCATMEPDARTPAQSSTEIKEGVGAEQADPQSPGWWGVLSDPLLVALVERSNQDDLDLSEALARVREARALRVPITSDRFPTISAGGAAPRAQGSEETDAGPTNELHSLRFDASWELDVFGGPRSVAAAKKAELEAGVEDVRDALVTLFAEVALNYVEVRWFQTRLSLADEHIRSQSEIYLITRWRQQAGLTKKRDFERARLSLEQTRAQIPMLEAGLEQARHRLAVLLDEPFDELIPELVDVKAIPSARVGLAVGVPADALRRRPDVRRAERELVAQLDPTSVGRHPSFTLSGSIGLDALPPGLQSTSAKMRSVVAGNVNRALFDADSIRQNIDAQTPLQEQALMGYEAAVITALKEVDDVLVAYTKGEARRESLERATQAAKSAAELANKRYISGQISFQALLDVQRSLLSLQDQLATSEGEVTSNLIRLYKALGGGWSSLDPAPAQAAPKEKEPLSAGRQQAHTTTDARPQ